jgi:hypothetical protein
MTEINGGLIKKDPEKKEPEKKDPIINEVELKMMMDINIPGNSLVEFTSSLINSDSLKKDGFSKYPFFTSQIEYPKSLNLLPFQEKFDFFFKKPVFLKILKGTPEYIKKEKKQKQKLEDDNKRFKAIYDEKLKNPNYKYIETEEEKERNTSELKEKNENQEIQNSISRKNIMFMLKILFPTKYYETTINTYDELFSGSKEISSAGLSSIVPLILNFFTGSKRSEDNYSYLNIPGKGVCTINNIIWLNDIYNHPEYKKIVEKFMKHNLWKIKESLKIDEKLENLKKVFKRKYSKIKTSDIVFNKQDISIKYDRYDTYHRSSRSSTKDKYELIYKSFIKVFEQILDNPNYEDILKFKNMYYALDKETNIISILERKIVELVKKDTTTSTSEELPYVKSEINETLSVFSFRECFIDLDHIIKLNDINDFLTNPNLDIDFDTEKQITQEQQRNLTQTQKLNLEKIKRIRSWEGFTEVSSFNEIIKNIKKLESTNSLLQIELEKFIKNKTNKIYDLMTPENSKDPSNLPFIDTGVSLPENSNGTIVLRVDIIGGKVDDKNRSKIKCIFNGERLGNELQLLMKPNPNFWELNKTRFFFDIKKESSIILDENKKEVKSIKDIPVAVTIPNSEPIPLAIAVPVKGGLSKKTFKNKKRSKKRKSIKLKNKIKK